MPHRGHAAHNGGANQHQNHGAFLGFKFAHHAFVARKQAWYTTCRCGVHRKQITWYMNHAQQLTRNRHVNTVVIPRA